MPISEKLKTLIRSAWDDGAPCLVATQGSNGPNISPKGSMVVFDDDHLAYWERSKKQALDNLGHDKRVCVMYANFKAQRDGILDSGFLRFWGTAELHENGPVHDKIFNLLLPRKRRAGIMRRRIQLTINSDFVLILAAVAAIYLSVVYAPYRLLDDNWVL